MSADIAVVGLAVMGQNLILNMNDHGFVVSFKKNILFLIIFFLTYKSVIHLFRFVHLIEL